jgi:hypothetical protein
MTLLHKKKKKRKKNKRDKNVCIMSNVAIPAEHKITRVQA